jgi:hypothetical protein
MTHLMHSCRGRGTALWSCSSTRTHTQINACALLVLHTTYDLLALLSADHQLYGNNKGRMECCIVT